MIYTDVFRGIPVILLVYLIGFGVPARVVTRVGKSADLGHRDARLSYSAYTAEIIRSGIDGVHESQRAAARRSE